MLDKTVWENRHTTRLFSEENTDIPSDDLKYLETVINNIPSQCSIKSHFWIYLGQSAEDMKLRTWLADNVFWIMQQRNTIKEHMLGVIQAPAIILSIRCSDPWANTEPDKTDEDHRELATRSEGLHAGVILATLLNMNYNVATFGCTSGLHSDEDEKDFNEKKAEFQKMIRDRYANELEELVSKFPGEAGNWDDIEFFPSISTCFGPEAIDKQEVVGDTFDKWTSPSGKDYRFYNGVKTRTPAASCVGFRRNYE